MAFTFNVGKGRTRQLVADAATMKIVLLKQAESDPTLQDYDTIEDLLDAVENVEADFTNYSRKTLSGFTVNVDDQNDRVSIAFDDVIWTGAGGTTDNTLTRAIIYYDVDGTDANAVPISGHTYVASTDGTDLTLRSDPHFWSSQDAA